MSVASGSSVRSFAVASVTRTLSTPGWKVTLVGAASVSTASPPLTVKDTVSGVERSSPSVRVRMNDTYRPSVTVAVSAATVTSKRPSLSRVRTSKTA